MLTKTKLADLNPGDLFYSLRESEGLLTVVCPQGECEHEKRDRFNMHVVSRQHRSEFFHQGAPDDQVDAPVRCNHRYDDGRRCTRYSMITTDDPGCIMHRKDQS